MKEVCIACVDDNHLKHPRFMSGSICGCDAIMSQARYVNRDGTIDMAIYNKALVLSIKEFQRTRVIPKPFPVQSKTKFNYDWSV